MIDASKRRALVRRYVGTFEDKANDIDARCSAWVSSRDEHDEKSLRSALHRIAGSGGAYGFPQLTDLARDGETASPEHLAERASALSAELRRLASEPPSE